MTDKGRDEVVELLTDVRAFLSPQVRLETHGLNTAGKLLARLETCDVWREAVDAEAMRIQEERDAWDARCDAADERREAEREEDDARNDHGDWG